jgi:transposase
MRALFAIAHKLTQAVYRVFTTGQPYKDLGETYLDRRNPASLARTLVARLQRLGFDHNSVSHFFRGPNRHEPQPT